MLNIRVYIVMNWWLVSGTKTWGTFQGLWLPYLGHRRLNFIIYVKYSLYATRRWFCTVHFLKCFFTSSLKTTKTLARVASISVGFLACSCGKTYGNVCYAGYLATRKSSGLPREIVSKNPQIKKKNMSLTYHKDISFQIRIDLNCWTVSNSAQVRSCSSSVVVLLTSL